MPKRVLQGEVVSNKQAKTVVVRVKPGRILFEIDGVTTTVAREALDLAAAKLPIKTRFVERIAE